MIKVSNYIADFLYRKKLRHVFMMVGGGAMHLNDSFGKHTGLEVVFSHHEQACAIAAESYARLTGLPAIVNVTTGPGGLNALTGVFGAWTDSIPMIVISGQVRYDTTVRSTNLPLRQLGDQEYDIIRSVEPMTKYSAMVIDPKKIRYCLEKALYLAMHGRPGPVWLDIPMDVQGAMIKEQDLVSFVPKGDKTIKQTPKADTKTIRDIIKRIQKAERPVVIVGTGVRIADRQRELLEMVEQLKIPVVTAWNAHDLVPDNFPYYCGRPGTVGDRAGNFAVQNSDLLLVLGCRLNIRQISYDWEAFARVAYKVMVDIDPAELKKPTLKVDLPVWCDLKDFMSEMLVQLKQQKIVQKSEWIKWTQERKKKYPVVLPEYWKRKKLINPYCFMEELGRQLPENQIVVCGDGSAGVVSLQVIPIKKNQRIYSNSGCAAMGYDLPAAIGACVGSNAEKIVCLAGDGSLQLNFQELAMIAFNKYPIKIFVLNNNGYHSMRQTQISFFGEPLVGCDQESGLSFPEIKKLACMYGLRYEKCYSHNNMAKGIEKTLNGRDPVICEVMLTTEQNFAPKSASKKLSNGKIVSRPLEDLAPFLSKEELQENMLID